MGFISTIKGKLGFAEPNPRELSRYGSIAGPIETEATRLFQGYIHENPANALYNPVKAPTSYKSTRGYIDLWGHDESIYDAWEEIVHKNLNVAALIEQRIAMVSEREQEIRVEVSTTRSEAARELIIRNTLDISDGFGWESRLGQFLFARFFGVTVHELIWSRERIGELEAIKHRWNGQFRFDKNANLYLLKRAGDVEEAPQNKFVVTRSGLPLLWDNPYGSGIIHRLIFLDGIKRNAEYWWARYIETFAQPTIIARYKGGSESQSVIAQIKSAIQQVGKNLGVIMPDGVEIDQLARTVSNGRIGSHRDLVTYIESLESRLILGSTLTTAESSAGDGSRAMAQVHETSTDRRVAPDARMVMQAVNSQIIEPLLRFNFPNLAPEEKPYLFIQTESEEEDNAKIERIRGLVDVGVTLRADDIREEFGYAKPDDGDDIIGGMPPQPAANARVSGAQFKESSQNSFSSKSSVSFSEKFYTPRAATHARAVIEVVDVYSQPYLRNLRRRFDGYMKRLGERVGDGLADDILAALRTDYFEIPLEELADDLTQLFIGAQALAFTHLADEWEEQAGEPMPPLRSLEFREPGEFEEYAEALEWFVDRRVLSSDEAERFLDYLISQGVNESVAMQHLRDRALFFAGNVDQSVALGIRDTLVQAVELGMDFTQFEEAIYKLIPDPTKLPAGGTARLETIYRNETNRIYHQQREELYSDPVLRSRLLGFEWYNPNDERSRPDHAALIGFIPIDHPAANEVPPLGHNCRCAKYPVMKLPGRNPQAGSNLDAWDNLDDTF